MATPAYAKQPKDIKQGAWVRFKTGYRRWLAIGGTVEQIIKADYVDCMQYTTENKDGRTTRGPVFAHEVELLTAEEAAPYIAARAARIERDRNVAANRLPDVSGRSHFARAAARRY